MQRGRQDRTRPRSSSRRHFETRAGRHGPGGRWLAGSRCRSCGSTARRFRPGGCGLGSSSCRPGSGAAHRHLPFQPLNPARVISMDGEDNSLTAPTCKEFQKLCDVVWQQTRACWTLECLEWNACFETLAMQGASSTRLQLHSYLHE